MELQEGFCYFKVLPGMDERLNRFFNPLPLTHRSCVPLFFPTYGVSDDRVVRDRLETERCYKKTKTTPFAFHFFDDGTYETVLGESLPDLKDAFGTAGVKYRLGTIKRRTVVPISNEGERSSSQEDIDRRTKPNVTRSFEEACSFVIDACTKNLNFKRDYMKRYLGRLDDNHVPIPKKDEGFNAVLYSGKLEFKMVLALLYPWTFKYASKYAVTVTEPGSIFSRRLAHQAPCFKKLLTFVNRFFRLRRSFRFWLAMGMTGNMEIARWFFSTFRPGPSLDADDEIRKSIGKRFEIERMASLESFSGKGGPISDALELMASIMIHATTANVMNLEKIDSPRFDELMRSIDARCKEKSESLDVMRYVWSSSYFNMSKEQEGEYVAGVGYSSLANFVLTILLDNATDRPFSPQEMRCFCNIYYIINYMKPKSFRATSDTFEGRNEYDCNNDFTGDMIVESVAISSRRLFDTTIEKHHKNDVNDLLSYLVHSVGEELFDLMFYNSFLEKKSFFVDFHRIPYEETTPLKLLYLRFPKATTSTGTFNKTIPEEHKFYFPAISASNWFHALKMAVKIDYWVSNMPLDMDEFEDTMREFEETDPSPTLNNFNDLLEDQDVAKAWLLRFSRYETTESEYCCIKKRELLRIQKGEPRRSMVKAVFSAIEHVYTTWQIMEEEGISNSCQGNPFVGFFSDEDRESLFKMIYACHRYENLEPIAWLKGMGIEIDFHKF
jgi:hypothetical protein